MRINKINETSFSDLNKFPGIILLWFPSVIICYGWFSWTYMFCVRQKFLLEISIFFTSTSCRTKVQGFLMSC